MRLVVQVARVAMKLLETVQSRIVKAGKAKAVMMLETYSQSGGVFSWAPQLRGWLNDPRYVWYLGIMEVNA